MNDALVDPVARFVDDLVAVMMQVTLDLKDVTHDKLRHDVTLEAFNLVAAFVDCDGLHTDEELWALIAAFASRLDTELLKAAPDDVRKAGLVDGKRAYLAQVSVLFDILVRSDQRNSTANAKLYYDRAMALAFTVASLDSHTSETELGAIESFRGLLLAAMNAAAPPPGGTGAPTTDAGGTPVPAAAGATGNAKPATLATPDPPPRPLEDLMAELDGLVGMKDVKAEVRLIGNLIQVEKLRKARNLPVLEQSHHLVFTGNPGTGKTTVARLLAQIYRTLGLVTRGHLVESDRSQLVAGYVGQTAAKVRAAFDQADQGVLLIDEAYALIRGGDDDFGKEAIDTIVKLVEDRRESIVVIVAGYPDEMSEFLDFNPGMRSRFPKTIFFPDYSDEELVEIFEHLGADGKYVLAPDAKAKLLDCFKAVPRTKGFGNGRFARNLFEASVTRQATRIVGVKDPTDEELCTLTAADLPDPAAAVPT
jgi:Cdc6-like AAA superfamily ATPase